MPALQEQAAGPSGLRLPLGAVSRLYCAAQSAPWLCCWPSMAARVSVLALPQSLIDCLSAVSVSLVSTPRHPLLQLEQEEKEERPERYSCCAEM